MYVIHISEKIEVLLGCMFRRIINLVSARIIYRVNTKKATQLSNNDIFYVKNYREEGTKRMYCKLILGRGLFNYAHLCSVVGFHFRLTLP